MPSLLVFLSVLPFQNSGQKSLPATIAHKGFNTAFQPFRGVRMPPTPQGGTQARTGANTGLHGFELWCPMQTGSLAENGPAKICRLVSDFPNLSGILRLQRRTPPDYGVVEFSHRSFRKANLFKAFLFCLQAFSCCCSSYLFPPQILNGIPPPRSR